MRGLRVLVTGASGFIGRAVCKQAAREGWAARPALRKYRDLPAGGVESIVVGEVTGATDWSRALDDIEVVVHLAARAHILQETAVEPLADFRRVNTEGTLNLARQAAAAGVRRFVFLSSLGVNGNRTLGEPFTESSTPKPHDWYTISKFEAEQGLMAITHETGMEVVIIRPPLVYGPGVKANFARLLRLVDSGAPLPFASVRNARGLIFLGNLVDFITLCLKHPAAAGQTFLVSDGHDLSTPELIRKLAQALGKPARLLPCPPALLRLLGAVSGRSREIDRLCGSLTVDNTAARAALAWRPPFTVEQGLRQTVDWYRQGQAEAVARGKL